MGQILIKSLLITSVLIAFAIPGFILRRNNMTGDGAKLTLSNILLYVCQPALIVSAFCVFDNADELVLQSINKVTLLINFCISGAISLAAIVLVYSVCRLLFMRYKNKSKADIYSFIAVFSNCGFLGVPFVQMFTDGNITAVMYLMMFNTVFTVASWTLGVYLITHDRSDISAKKVLLNPSMISTAFALLLFFVPQINFFAMDGCRELGIFPQYLGIMTAPVSMILVGINCAELKPHELFCDKGVYVSSLLRLIVAPILTFAVAVLFYAVTKSYITTLDIETDYVFLAPVIAMAMSPASLAVAMTERFGGERDVAAAAFITGTLLALITIPLTILAATELWKVIV